jgi:hypothetical protein
VFEKRDEGIHVLDLIDEATVARFATGTATAQTVTAGSRIDSRAGARETRAATSKVSKTKDNEGAR